MVKNKWLDKVSNTLFTIGGIVGFSRFIPLNYLSTLSTVFSQLFYLIGYGLWFLTGKMAVSNSKDPRDLHNFAQFQHKYLLAALIGIIATAFAIIALVFPFLIVPASWLIFISNVFWVVAEFYNLHSPSINQDNFTNINQHSYVNYSILVTLTSLLAAFTATACLLLPLYFTPVTVLGGLISVGIGILTFYSWLESQFENPEIPKSMPTPSYQKMMDSLPKTISEEVELNELPSYPSPMYKNIRLANDVENALESEKTFRI